MWGDFAEKFPYYIVRFKLRTGTQNFHPLTQFPYYIVRFKHVGDTAGTKLEKGVSILHSTI